MGRFCDRSDFWDCAAKGDTKRLLQHIRSRVSVRRVAKTAGIDEACPWTGMTALHLACCNGKSRAAKLLLEHGASPSVQTQDGTGRTPLHLACENGQLSTCAFLLELFPSTRDLTNDSHGNSVIHAACKSGNLRLVQLFFQKYGASALVDLVEPGEFDEDIDEFLEERFQTIQRAPFAF